MKGILLIIMCMCLLLILLGVSVLYLTFPILLKSILAGLCIVPGTLFTVVCVDFLLEDL